MTDADLLTHVQAVRSDPGFDPALNQFVDLSDVTDVVMTSAGIRSLAAANPFGPGARRAVVAPLDLTYGMARMYQLLCEPTARHHLAIFRDMPSAVAWLGTAVVWDLLDAVRELPPLVDGGARP